MTNQRNHSHEERVLLLAPTARDGRLSAAVLAEAGLGYAVVADVSALCHAIGQGAGVVVLHQEALQQGGLALLATALAEQPVWSDLPVIMLVAQPPPDATAASLRQLLGNLLLLERPIRLATLLSAVQSAMRARRRQYQVRLLSEIGQVLTA